MPQRSLLVADDIENRTDPGKRLSQAILSAASSLALGLKTAVELLYVEDSKSYPRAKFDPAGIQAWHARHQEILEEAGRRLRVPVRCSLTSGSPAERILTKLHSRPAFELVIVGTRGLKGFRRLFIGSVAEEVIRYARRPVMVIGPNAQKKELSLAGRKPASILVPTDLGKNSRAAELYAVSLAKRLGARVVLFHCLGDNYHAIVDQSMASGMIPFNFENVLDELREDAIKSLKQKTGIFQKHGVPCEYKIEESLAQSSCAVYKESEQGYSFAVMGTHGRNVLLQAFIGSTARETILNAPVPVITVHAGK
jgi:nucleotide-binding universal stress UspA family protein